MYQPAQPPPRRKGYFAALVDLRFEELVTPKLIKVTYVIVLAVTAFNVFWWTWVGLALPDWMGWGVKLLMVTGVPAAGLLTVTVVRMFLEYLMIQFSIRDEMRKVRINLERMNGIAPPPPAQPYPPRPATPPPGGPWPQRPPYDGRAKDA